MGISWDEVEEAAEVRKSWRRGIVVSPNASLTRAELETRNDRKSIRPIKIPH